MKKVFVLALVLTFGLILAGCPPKKVVQPEPQQQPVVTQQEKAVEVKPEEKITEKKITEEKVPEQQIAKAETKKTEAPVVTQQEKAVEVKPEEKITEKKITEEKVPEQQIAKAETKEIEAPVHIEESSVFEDIHFDFDKYDIRQDAKSALQRIASRLLKNTPVRILIEGHCDERGTNEYNLALGDRRARATRDYLAALGVASGKIEMISYGEESPLCTDKTEECWQKNRRSHFVVQKENR